MEDDLKSSDKMVYPPFYKHKETESKDMVISTKWNEKEFAMLKKGAQILKQPKKGTTIKMLAKIGYAKVVQDEKMIDSVLDSYRRNKRLGIPEINVEIERNFRKSNTK